MSSFPEHVSNIKALKGMGFDMSEAMEGDEVSIESWGYDEQVDTIRYIVQVLQKQGFRVNSDT